jgi:hypothetical protein
MCSPSIRDPEGGVRACVWVPEAAAGPNPKAATCLSEPPMAVSPVSGKMRLTELFWHETQEPHSASPGFAKYS